MAAMKHRFLVNKKFSRGDVNLFDEGLPRDLNAQHGCTVFRHPVHGSPMHILLPAEDAWTCRVPNRPGGSPSRLPDALVSRTPNFDEP